MDGYIKQWTTHTFTSSGSWQEFIWHYKFHINTLFTAYITSIASGIYTEQPLIASINLSDGWIDAYAYHGNKVVVRIEGY